MFNRANPGIAHCYQANWAIITSFSSVPCAAFFVLFLLRRTEGADEKIAEGLPAVIGEVAGSGAGKRI